MESIIFTPAAVLELLVQIPELAQYNINFTETIGGDLQLTIGDSFYLIEAEEAPQVNVDESVVNAIDDINTEAYESLVIEHSLESVEGDDIEAGLLKEIFKTLAIGGMARLGAKLLR